MAIVHNYGNMWDAYDRASLMLVTTNSYIARKGNLVMGAGAARQARDKFPGIDYAYGEHITKKFGQLALYGVVTPGEVGLKNKVGIFQVKMHYKEDADPVVIATSAATLTLLLRSRSEYGRSLHMNFPGIGYGNMEPLHVLSLLDKYLKVDVPVNLWRYREEE